MRSTGILALAFTLTGCSWIFQDRLRGEYDGRSEPQCSTSRGWAWVDAILGGLSGGEALIAIDSTGGSERDAAIIGGIIGAVVHGASSASGWSWSSTCREAYADWDKQPGGIEQKREAERAGLARSQAANPGNDPAKASMYWCSSIDRTCVADQETCAGLCLDQREVWCSFADGKYLCARTRGTCTELRSAAKGWRGECVVQKAQLPYVPKVEPKPELIDVNPPVVEPRGWYCYSSPTQTAVASCARQKADCETGRDAASTATPDVSTCILVETVQCFTAHARTRCAPNAAICGEQVTRAGDAGAKCEETK